MPARVYVSDLATAVLSTGGPDLATGALSLTVVSNTGFATSGSFFTVEAPTGEHITVTSGIGTTTWGGLIRGDNGTTAKIAAISNGAILKEVLGTRDMNNVVQTGDPALTNVRSIKKTGSAALTGDVTLTGGANVTLTQSGNDISIATTGGGGGSGTVTSVALSLPGLFTISGSPVTGSGTLTAVLATQSANTVLAGPTTGAAAAPTMRALVAADLPTSGVTAGTYGDATHVAVVTVDAAGRITSATSTAITGGGGGSSTLAGDTDVSISSPASGHALIYNGTAWANTYPWKVQLAYALASDVNGVSVTSATWTDLFANQSFTVDDVNSLIEIHYRLGCGLSVVSTVRIGARFVIDSAGTAINEPIGGAIASSAVISNPAYNGMAPFQGLAAGTHTVKVQVYSDGSAANLYCRPATTATEMAKLTVLERK